MFPPRPLSWVYRVLGVAEIMGTIVGDTSGTSVPRRPIRPSPCRPRGSRRPCPGSWSSPHMSCRCGVGGRFHPARRRTGQRAPASLAVDRLDGRVMARRHGPLHRKGPQGSFVNHGAVDGQARERLVDDLLPVVVPGLVDADILMPGHRQHDGCVARPDHDGGVVIGDQLERTVRALGAGGGVTPCWPCASAKGLDTDGPVVSMKLRPRKLHGCWAWVANMNSSMCRPPQ